MWTWTLWFLSELHFYHEAHTERPWTHTNQLNPNQSNPNPPQSACMCRLVPAHMACLAPGLTGRRKRKRKRGREKRPMSEQEGQPSTIIIPIEWRVAILNFCLCWCWHSFTWSQKGASSERMNWRIFFSSQLHERKDNNNEEWAPDFIIPYPN